MSSFIISINFEIKTNNIIINEKSTLNNIQELFLTLSYLNKLSREDSLL